MPRYTSTVVCSDPTAFETVMVAVSPALTEAADVSLTVTSAKTVKNDVIRKTTAVNAAITLPDFVLILIIFSSFFVLFVLFIFSSRIERQTHYLLYRIIIYQVFSFCNKFVTKRKSKFAQKGAASFVQIYKNTTYF